MGGMPQDVGPRQDVVLKRAAQAGDVSALALLLERHRPGMRAVAVSLLRPGPDVALRRIVDIRDPEAVGPWLRMGVASRAPVLFGALRAPGKAGAGKVYPEPSKSPPRPAAVTIGRLRRAPGDLRPASPRPVQEGAPARTCTLPVSSE